MRRASERILQERGKWVSKHTTPQAKYQTPRGKQINILQLADGRWEPRFYKGGPKGFLGTFTSFDDAEKAVVKFIKKKKCFPWYPQPIYPDKYKEMKP